MKVRPHISIEEDLHKAGQEEAKRISQETGEYVSFSALLVYLLKKRLNK